MSLRYFIHILFKRKWYILTALFFAPLIALGFLVFAEPIYVSHCKLEVFDRSSDNDPVATRRSNIKDDVNIQKHIEIIYTDQVMSKVVDKAGLMPEPPSQSMYNKYMKTTPAESKFSPERARIEAIRGAKKRITANAISPVVLDISAQMNTPELAQRMTQAVYDAYYEEFERLQNIDSKFEEDYKQRLAVLTAEANAVQNELVEFNKSHPRDTKEFDPLRLPNQIDAPPPDPVFDMKMPKPNQAFVQRMKEISPAQKIMNEIATLELQLRSLFAQGYSPDHFKVKKLEEQIVEDKKLLEVYKKDLVEQEILAVQYSGLLSKQQMAIQSRDKINEEYQKVLTGRIKHRADSTIKVLDFPTYDPQAIFPKRTMIMIAAMFVGLMLGLGLAYIAHVLDSTYHLPEDFAADTGLPVLAALPFDKNIKPLTV